MRKITKSNEPASLTRWKRSNASGVYEDLTEIERRDIRAVCVQEQFYLCAYCCKPISGQNSDTMNEPSIYPLILIILLQVALQQSNVMNLTVPSCFH